MTQQELAAFMGAHPLECVLAALAVNGLGIMLILEVLKAVTRRRK